MSKLKKDYLVTKRNALNEMRSNNMKLQELRLFTIYLSKINPRDKNSRIVRFSAEEFETIMGVNPNSHVRISYYLDIADSLLNKKVKVPLEHGGFMMFGLFNYVKYEYDPIEMGYYFEIDAHNEALPLMFDYKDKYFSYQLWNTLSLKSRNQLRMYEILKQYEHIGHRVISVEDLKDMLGIDEREYPQFKHFRQYVLEVCKKALAESTDVSFTYEPHSKKGRKIHELKFTITKNKHYKNPLDLDKFIDLNDKSIIESDYQEINLDDLDENGNLFSTGTSPIYEERIALLMDACNNEFSREQIIVLFDNMPDHIKHDENTSHDYLQSKYREMDMRKPNKSRFGYIKKLIGEK